jgi:hypothetical protein
LYFQKDQGKDPGHEIGDGVRGGYAPDELGFVGLGGVIHKHKGINACY